MSLFRLLLLLLVSACLPAQAQENPRPSVVTLGHTAPGVPPIQVEIDGSIIAQLSYLEFRIMEIPPGLRQVRILDRDSGAVLTQTTTEWDEDRAGWLSLYGDGGRLPLTLAQYQSLRPVSPDSANIGILNLGPHPHEIVLDCRSGGNSSGRRGTLSVGSGSIASSRNNCRYQATQFSDTGTTALPAIDFTVPNGAISFVVHVGNGAAESPLRIILVQQGVLVPTTPAAVPDALRVVRSPHYWYDSGRFSQGVTLYEASRTLAVQGMWNTYAADGRPRWLYLDGGVVDPSGRREVLLSEYQMDAQGRRIGTPVGRGTLTYLDCNNAEMQVRFADGQTLATQFRRSVTVERCDAVP